MLCGLSVICNFPITARAFTIMGTFSKKKLPSMEPSGHLDWLRLVDIIVALGPSY